jgi:predicted dehydrogenase
MRKVQWGVLGVARIATTQVIPAMRRGEFSEVAGIASRDLAKAQKTARDLGIPKVYGSYEEMLADPEIEAVYNPLPNHLHVPWSIRAAQAGKHVLCEKPIGMSVAETRELIAARDRTGVTMGEAFMVRTHPQWLRIEELVRAGRLGQLRYALGSFAYSNLNPANIRNIREYGGGALMDIGCYPIKVSRFVFGEEPVRVAASIDRDPAFGGIDRLTSAILEYPSGPCIFTCTTQAIPNQSMRFFGTKASIEPEIPFNAPKDRPSHIRIDEGAAGTTVEEFPPCDQYTIQGDLFSRAIREGGAPPVPLEDALKNMAVIEAVFRAGESGKWEKP